VIGLMKVNNSVTAQTQFKKIGDKISKGEDSVETICEAMAVAIGKQAVDELNVGEMQMENFNLVLSAIMALMQGVEMDKIEERFRS